MEVVELAKCECCGLREDCTREYISSVKANFDEKWFFCGLCSEAVRYELSRGRWPRKEAAITAHMSFCRKTARSNPAVRVADGMRQMLRRSHHRSSPAAAADSSSSSSSPSPCPAVAPSPAPHEFGDLDVATSISFSFEIIN